MAFERPTLKEIVERVSADAASRSGKQNLRWSTIGVLSRVVAGVAHSLYGYIEFVLRQIFSSTAEGQYLERRASEYGITRKAAVAATGTVTFIGSAVVPSGTLLQSPDSIQYLTTADSSDNQAPIIAVEPGLDSNAQAGLELSLVSPILGVQSTATASEISGGVDAETDESLRERLLNRQKNPPKAGTKSDYVSWALSVPSVTRAWCYPMELGLGNVTVRFMTDRATSNGIPNDEAITAVEDYINSQMPVTTILTVVAPIPKSLDMTLDILPDTEEARLKIKGAVEQAILREAEPGGIVLYSSLDRAVAGVSEVLSYRIVSPTDDVTTNTGEILVPGMITYQ